MSMSRTWGWRASTPAQMSRSTAMVVSSGLPIAFCRYHWLRAGWLQLKAGWTRTGLAMALACAQKVSKSASSEAKNSTVVGQFPPLPGDPHFGMTFQKGSSLVACVDRPRLHGEGVPRRAHEQTAAGLAIAVCEFTDEAAAVRGRQFSKDSFDRVMPNRTLVLNVVGLTPVAQKTFNNYTLDITKPEHHPRYLSTLSLSMALPILVSPLVSP